LPDVVEEVYNLPELHIFLIHHRQQKFPMVSSHWKIPSVLAEWGGGTGVWPAKNSKCERDILVSLRRYGLSECRFVQTMQAVMPHLFSIIMPLCWRSRMAVLYTT